MSIVRSHKGKQIDMTALINANSKVVAAGNMKINARGDLIGKGGKIIKTKEQLAAEYYNTNPMAVEVGTAPLNSSMEDMLSSPKNNAPVTFASMITPEQSGSSKTQKKKQKDSISSQDKSTLDSLDVLESADE